MTQYELDVLERAYNISQHIHKVQSRLEIENLRRILLKDENESLINAIECELQRFKCIYNILMLTLLTKKQIS